MIQFYSMKFKFKLIILTILLCLSFSVLSLRHQNVYTGIRDIEYKKNIIKDSANTSYKLENMTSIVGPEELSKFIQKNDEHPETYASTPDNISKGKFRANLHMHTLNSDGALTVQELLDSADNYANTLNNGYFYVAITDHNTTQGLKQAVDILQKNPKKYRRLKVVLGMEVFSVFAEDKKVLNSPIDIHVLCWTIDPYDKTLNQIFIKSNPKDKYNYSYRTFNDAISLMNNYGITGIAHPARYVEDNKLKTSKENYIDELFAIYKKLSLGKIIFTEGYYQSYDKSIDKKFANYINSEARNEGIIRTGSLDTHGKNIFSH